MDFINAFIAFIALSLFSPVFPTGLHRFVNSVL